MNGLPDLATWRHFSTLALAFGQPKHLGNWMAWFLSDSGMIDNSNFRTADLAKISILTEWWCW